MEEEEEGGGEGCEGEDLCCVRFSFFCMGE